MSDPTLVHPLRYQPFVEQPEDDEVETTQELVETLLGMARTMADHTGHAMRSVHAKSHGLLRGELTVHGNLPPQLAQGIFARPRSYPVLLRLSSPPAEELPDNVSTPRGLAVKILDVAGDRLKGSEGHTTQDFLMVNGPTFNTATAKKFLGSVKLLAATTDKSPGGKQFLSAILRGTEKVIEAVGGESATLKAMGGHPQTHPLGESYFTQVPVRYGDHIAKLSIAPVSPALTALTDAPLAMKGKPDAMREAVAEFFSGPDAANQAAVWELRVQLCTSLETMPVEDASVTWPEDQSPYVAVARLTVGSQAASTDEHTRAVEDSLSFNPWHGITAHQPLGSIMRARRAAYAASADFRSQRNGCPLHEPRGPDDLPTAA